MGSGTDFSWNTMFARHPILSSVIYGYTLLSSQRLHFTAKYDIKQQRMSRSPNVWIEYRGEQYYPIFKAYYTLCSGIRAPLGDLICGYEQGQPTLPSKSFTHGDVPVPEIREGGSASVDRGVHTPSTLTQRIANT